MADVVDYEEGIEEEEEPEELEKTPSQLKEEDIQEELKKLDEKFYFNHLLCKALMQLLPAPSRFAIRLWMDRLIDLNKTLNEMRIRNEYIWFILLMLQNNKIIDYFHNLPPDEILPLRHIFTQDVIDEVSLTFDQNMAWLQTVHLEHQNDDIRKRRVPPERFFESHPIPEEGVICYFSVFTDQS